MQAYTTAVAHAMPRSATHSADGCFLVGRARRGSESIGPRAIITRLVFKSSCSMNARDDAPCKNIADTADTPERAIDTADSI